MKNNKFAFIVLAPALIHIGIFLVLPMVGGLAISFMDYNPLNFINKFVGLDNYKVILQDATFYRALFNTLKFVFVTVGLNISLALITAQLVSSFKSNMTRSFFRMIFFLPCIAPMVASSIVWGRSIFSTKTGLVNMFLNSIGINSVNWLGDAKYIMISIIIYTLWVDIGYNLILFSAGIDGIPGEFYEAADIDGAGGLYKFFKITLPLLGRTLAFVIIMTLISHFEMFAQFSVMLQRTTPQDSGLVLTSYIYKTAFVNKDMGYASTISMMLFVIILIVTIIQKRLNKVDWDY
jgi:multiple sugar transport system permease protein/raffinose/stachyose/melibiose transport system permease protein